MSSYENEKKARVAADKQIEILTKQCDEFQRELNDMKSYNDTLKITLSKEMDKREEGKKQHTHI